MTSDFLPIEGLKAVDCLDAPPGTLAFIPQSGIRHFALFFRDAEGVLHLLDLGGTAPLGIWKVEDGYGPAVIIPGWRLEVDPTSAVPTQFSRLPLRHAFVTTDARGLVGCLQPHARTNLPVTTEGAVAVDNINKHRSVFMRWRIVCGSEQDPFVITDNERCGVTPAA